MVSQELEQRGMSCWLYLHWCWPACGCSPRHSADLCSTCLPDSSPFLLHASQPLTTTLQHKLTLSRRWGLALAFELHEVPGGPFLQPVLKNFILPLLLPSLTLLANLHWLKHQWEWVLYINKGSLIVTPAEVLKNIYPLFVEVIYFYFLQFLF